MNQMCDYDAKCEQAFHNGHVHQQKGTHPTGGCNASPGALQKCVRKQQPAMVNSMNNVGGRQTLPDRTGEAVMSRPAASKPLSQ